MKDSLKKIFIQYFPVISFLLIMLFIFGPVAFAIVAGVLFISSITLFRTKRSGKVPAPFYEYIYRLAIFWVISFSIAILGGAKSSNAGPLLLILNIIPGTFIFIYHFKASFFLSSHKIIESQQNQIKKEEPKAKTDIERIIDKLDEF